MLIATRLGLVAGLCLLMLAADGVVGRAWGMSAVGELPSAGPPPGSSERSERPGKGCSEGPPPGSSERSEAFVALYQEQFRAVGAGRPGAHRATAALRRGPAPP
ncbi:MAG TPA: hypothetical protein VHS99_12360 [Chloroflexota bacterium]|nr:hypothetical protein [Chloroflexota bacterium]